MHWIRKPLLRLGAIRNAITQSLFFVPAVVVFLAVVLSQATIWIDRRVGDEILPSWLGSTVESSRSILSAVAGGTITAASVVFSLTLVAVQLASSQFSPRVLRGFLGDRFQQLVMGTVVGTFAYSLLVLREVRSAGESGDGAFEPRISIAVAVIFALLSLVAVLGSIDHTAKSLRVGSVADNILDATLATMRRELTDRRDRDEGDTEVDAALLDAPRRSPSSPDFGADLELDVLPSDAGVVNAPRTGWVTGVELGSLASNLSQSDEDISVLVTAAVGSYVVEGTPVLYLWPAGEDVVTSIENSFESIIRIGNVRTMQQDIGFGIVQLVDVAVRSLSPGVNDPNTAEEVIVRLGAILTQLYRSEMPPRRLNVDGQTVIRPEEPDYGAYVDLAIEPIRRFARTDPRVLEALARTIAGVISDAERRFDAPDVSALRRQLSLMSAEIDHLETAEDRRRVAELLSNISTSD